MEVRIAGRTIKGTILPFRPPGREHIVARTHYPGLAGESEISLDTAGRDLSVEIILHDSYTRESLHQYVDQLLQRSQSEGGYVGIHGTLEVDSPAGVRQYENTTYDGFDEGDPAMIEDIAGTLGGGWICHGLLRFRQLK